MSLKTAKTRNNNGHPFNGFLTSLPHSPDKKFPTFVDEIARKMSNKCTFINPNSL